MSPIKLCMNGLQHIAVSWAINALCVQNVELFNEVHEVASRLQGVGAFAKLNKLFLVK
jgi:hypothetical protein